MGIAEQTLSNWRKASKTAVTRNAITPEWMKISRLRAENSRLQMELEILEKPRRPPQGDFLRGILREAVPVKYA